MGLIYLESLYKYIIISKGKIDADYLLSKKALQEIETNCLLLKLSHRKVEILTKG